MNVVIFPLFRFGNFRVGSEFEALLGMNVVIFPLFRFGNFRVGYEFEALLGMNVVSSLFSGSEIFGSAVVISFALDRAAENRIVTSVQYRTQFLSLILGSIYVY